jgi:N-acetylmuramoyl-L-alanine amidase
MMFLSFEAMGGMNHCGRLYGLILAKRDSMLPYWIRLPLLLLFFYAGQVWAVNLPGLQTHGDAVVFRISKDLPTRDIFTLINPERLVVDQLNTAGTLLALREWKKNHPALPCITEIRAGLKPAHQARLVIEVSPSCKANLMKQAHYVEWTVSPNTNIPITRLQQVSTSIQPHPIDSAKKEMPSQKKQMIVVIDPGHGGKDPGATGRKGTHEKTIVLEIARQLAVLLNKSPRYHAILTRNSDYYIPLRDRLLIARKQSADLFISIHADAFSNTKARGSSVYALSQRGATSEAARWLAQNENASERMGGVELDNKSKLLRSVLINLSQTASVRDSLSIGSSILYSLNQVNLLHHRRVEQAAFVVLKSPDIPSLLIETGFLSNRHEEKLLNSPSQQRIIAKAIYEGINKYFNVYKYSHV